MENQENAQPEVAQDGATTQPDLTISDLQNLRAIIDVAVRRGAFSASEVSGVGAAFDKLNVFLNAVAPPKAQEPVAKQ